MRWIGSSFWQDTCWGPEVPVTLPDPAVPHAYRPGVSWRGGALWCVWFGGPTGNYGVYASRWDSVEGVWEPETQVSPPDGNLHWWCDVAVDARGTPHVVWVEYPHYLLLYSFWDGVRWTAPEAVNDTAEFTVSPWGNPRIAMDSAGTFHVSVTGARVGAAYRNILYTRNAGDGWKPMEMVTESNYPEWYADIAVAGPEDIWVVFSRQVAGFRVYARHFDGREWSPEERLCDETAPANATTGVGVDGRGLPWAVWAGPGSNIYYNRYVVSAGLADTADGVALPEPPLVLVAATAPGGAAISYELPQSAIVSLTIFDLSGRHTTTLVEEFRPAGRHSVRWHADVPAGVYFLRLRAGVLETGQKLVLGSR